MKLAIKGLLLPLAMAAALGATEDPWTFAIQAEASRLTIEVGSAGLFQMFGHDHLIEARRFAGTVSWHPDQPDRSSVVFEVEAASLTVVDEDVDEEERAEIQADMEAKALAIEQYPAIRFTSQELDLEEQNKGLWEGAITGELSLRGETQRIQIPLQVRVSGKELTASGELTLRGSDFGVPQISVAGGTVKTKDELELAFELVATRSQ